MKLEPLAKMLWGTDFVNRPHLGYCHMVYKGIASEITLSAVKYPFQKEDKATSISISWCELIAECFPKSITPRIEISQRNRRVNFAVIKGRIDGEKLREAAGEAAIQVGRNRLILMGQGVK